MNVKGSQGEESSSVTWKSQFIKSSHVKEKKGVLVI